MAAGEGIPDLVEVPVRSFGYYLAAPKGAGERLTDIAAALERITLTDRFHRIVERTLLPAPNVPDWRDHLRHLAILVVGFGGAVVLVLLWNNSLRPTGRAAHHGPGGRPGGRAALAGGDRGGAGPRRKTRRNISQRQTSNWSGRSRSASR